MRLVESPKANAVSSFKFVASGRSSQKDISAAIGAADLVAVLGFSCYIFWELLGVFDSLPFISPYFSFEELLGLKLGAFFIMTVGFFVLAYKGASFVNGKERTLVAISAALVAGTLIISFAIAAMQAATFVLGAITWCLYSLSLTLLMVAWAVHFEANYTRRTPKVIAMGYALGFSGFFLCSLSAPIRPTILFLFIGFASAASTIGLLAFLMRTCTVKRDRESTAQAGVRTSAQADARKNAPRERPTEALEKPSSPWLSPLRVLQTMAFGVCYGFVITLLQFSGQRTTTFGVLGGLVGSIVLLIVLQKRGLVATPDICHVTFIPVAVAMLFLPIGDMLPRVVCGMVVVSASIFTAASSWICAAQSAAQSGCNPVKLFSLTKAPGWGGFLVGVFAAALVIVVEPQLVTIVVAILVALVCASFALSVLNAPSRTPDSAEEKPQPEAEPAFPAQTIHDQLDSITMLYGLSPREVDVLVLLAKGRNAEFIADKLSIARPTAKTHIQHIYQKTVVNSQQELISLIDSELEKASPNTSAQAPVRDCARVSPAPRPGSSSGGSRP